VARIHEQGVYDQSALLESLDWRSIPIALILKQKHFSRPSPRDPMGACIQALFVEEGGFGFRS
jgi:hypothetical protein